MKRNLIHRIAGAVMVVLVAGTMLIGCDAKQAGEASMKFVNVQMVLVDSGLLKQEQDHLKAVNESLNKGQQLAEKNYTSLPANKVDAARKADRNVLTQQWKGQQQAARNVVMAALKSATDAYRNDKKIGVILPTQVAMSVSPELDVSADLTQKLKTTKLEFPKLPDFAVKAGGPAAK